MFGVGNYRCTLRSGTCILQAGEAGRGGCSMRAGAAASATRLACMLWPSSRAGTMDVDNDWRACLVIHPLSLVVSHLQPLIPVGVHSTMPCSLTTTTTACSFHRSNRGSSCHAMPRHAIPGEPGSLPASILSRNRPADLPRHTTPAPVSAAQPAVPAASKSQLVSNPCPLPTSSPYGWASAGGHVGDAGLWNGGKAGVGGCARLVSCTLSLAAAHHPVWSPCLLRA